MSDLLYGSIGVRDLSDLPDDWDDTQRAVFMRQFRFLVENQAMVTHPESTPIPAEHWSTLAWNLAWLAADPLGEDDELVLLDPDGEQREIGRERPRVTQ